MSRLTESAPICFSTGYSDCVTCFGAGVVFYEMDRAVACPECDARDREMEEVLGLDNDGYFGSQV